MIEFFTGVMKSGKSEKLIEEIEKKLGSNNNVLIIKPSSDTRDGAFIKTRAHERKYPALLIDEKDSQMLELLFNSVSHYDTIFIDEVQFFSYGFIIKLSDYCYTHSTKMVASGLLKDFKGNYFPSSLYLLEYADKLHHCKGRCDFCNGDNEPRDILVDAKNMRVIGAGNSLKVEGTDKTTEYKTVCKTCYELLPKTREI